MWLETTLVSIHYEFVIHLPFNICSDTRALSRVLINTIVFIALIRQVRPAYDFHLAKIRPAANSFQKASPLQWRENYLASPGLQSPVAPAQPGAEQLQM